MIRHQSLDFSQLPDADVIISILFLQRVVELRPFLVELMEPLFAVVRDKHSCAGIADKSAGVLINVLLKTFPVIFFHDLTFPVVADYRLRLLRQALGLKHKVVAGVLRL